MKSHFWRDARIKAGLSQAEVAKRLGYTSGQYISNVERGVCLISHNVVNILVDMYDLDPSEVLEVLVAEQRAKVRKALGMDSRRVPRKRRLRAV